MKRRTFLIGAGVGAFGVGSVGAISANWKFNEPKLSKYFETHQYETLIEDGPTAQSGPPYYAKVIKSDTEMKQVSWAKLPESVQQDFSNLDFNDEFVAVFLSRYQISPPGSHNRAAPEVKFTDQELVFQVDQSTIGYETNQEDPFKYSDTLYAILQLWNHAGAKMPSRGVVKLD